MVSREIDDGETLALLADATSEALRAIAHDAANGVAVLDMELGELRSRGGDPAAVTETLWAATGRLREHVGDLRTLAGARSASDCALDEVVQLVLRVLSRSARRDLLAVATIRPARARVPQIRMSLALLAIVRAVVVADPRALIAVSVQAEPRCALARLVIDLPPIARARVEGQARRLIGPLGALVVEREERDGRELSALRIELPPT